MYFGGREIPNYATVLNPDDLVQGNDYYIMNFLDDNLFLPNVETLIYIGKNLKSENDKIDHFYFQDAYSYINKGRYDLTDVLDCETKVYIQESLAGFFSYESMLENLMRCSLMRKNYGMSS